MNAFTRAPRGGAGEPERDAWSRSWAPLPNHLDHRATPGGPTQILLGDAHLDPSHAKALEDRLGGGRRERFEQMEAPVLDDLAHRLIEAIVVDGIGQAVGELGAIVDRSQLEIDLDLLLYGNLVVEEPDLKVPHPELVHRSFVLVPLVELDPLLVHPVTGETLLNHLSRVTTRPPVKRGTRLWN